MFSKLWDKYIAWEKKRLTKKYDRIQSIRAELVEHLVDFERLQSVEGFTKEQAEQLKKPISNLLGKKLTLALQSYWGYYNTDMVISQAKVILQEALVETETKLGYPFPHREEYLAEIKKLK